MGKFVGTTVRGLIAPIMHKGDDIASIAVDALLNASEHEGFAIRDKDVLAITESVVARTQGNYVTTADIAEDIKQKFGDETIGVLFPILSRNRFSICLEGIARSGNKIVMMLSFPSDEVGNHLIDLDTFEEDASINPLTDVFTASQWKERFGTYKHPFTGMDYIDYYLSILHKYNKESTILISNNAKAVLTYTSSVLVCDIHTRLRTKKKLVSAGAKKVYTLDEVLREPINGSGFNADYGLLGSNKATEESVKLFPRDCKQLVDRIQRAVQEKTGKHIEVMVYGDGAFKDPVGKIWELADPVVSPAFTAGLEGTPCELKLKYLADNAFTDKSAQEQAEAITAYIHEHKKQAEHATDDMERQGTTPRRLTDLLGSLSDLTSGSGDKGTPIVFIQGYFDKFGE